MAVQNRISAEILENNIDISYPQVDGLPSERVEARINRIILRFIENVLTEAGIDKQTLIVKYDVEVNRNSILSIRFEIYTYERHAAHGMTYVYSFTFDLETGRVYHLRDLFRRGSNYVEVLSNIIKEQIIEREIPLINEFEHISPNQSFYLTEDALVIYFQLYEYTPYYVGIPEFPIPYVEIADIINEQGPIARLI